MQSPQQAAVVPVAWSRPHATPIVFLRIGGLPVEHMERLASPNLVEHVRKYLQWESELRILGEVLVDRLHSEISSITDVSVRHAILPLKRDVFNIRTLSDDPDAFADSLSAPLRHDLKSWAMQLGRVQSLISTGEQLCADEIVAKRRLLKDSALNEDFRKGLLLSSPIFEQSIDSYVQGQDVNLSRRLRKTEQTLMFYLARTCYKTTPFSTMTTLCYAVLDGSTEQFPRTVSPVVVSRVVPNAGLYSRLSENVQQHASRYPGLRVALKDHWTLEDGRVRFIRRAVTSIAHGGPMHGEVVESVFSIPASPSLRVLLDELESGPKTVVELRDTLKRRAELPDEESERLLALLCSLGLLVVPGLRRSTLDGEFWDGATRLWSTLGNERLAGLAEILGTVQNLAQEYSTSGIGRRRTVLRQIEERTKEALHVVDVQENSPLPLVYEDAAQGSEVLRMGQAAWQPYLNDLARLQSFLPAFDSSLPSKLAMEALFIRLYGRGGVCTDILRFAELYNRMYYVPFREASEEAAASRPDGGDGTGMDTPNPFHLPTIAAIDGGRNLLWRELHRLGRGEDSRGEIVLEQNLLDEVAAALPRTIHTLSNSFLCQFADGGEGSRLVINKVYGGYGGMYSRFANLNKNDSVLTESLRQNLLFLGSEDVIFAELQGGHDNNLNMHPLLAEAELLCPGERASQHSRLAIHVSDVILYHDARTGRLRLRCENLGKNVVPLFLGFMVPYALPELQQFLLLFSDSSFIRQQFLPPSIRTAIKPNHVRRIPRLRLGKLILERRRWDVLAQDLPRPEDGREFLYHAALQSWRARHGIPDQAFVSFARGRRTQSQGDDSSPAAMMHKPLFVDFQNLLSVRMFNKYLSGATNTISLTEVMPNRDQLWLKGEDGTRITEFVIEISQKVTS